MNRSEGPRRKVHWLLSVVLAGMTFSMLPCLGQAGEKYALLIGVREYDKTELRPLPYSEADVDALARLLRDSGYKSENVVVMTQTIGARRQRFLPVSTNIRKELGLIVESGTEADSLLIALAGHGVQFRGEDEPYFCPTDAKLSDRSTLIPLGQFYESLKGAKANLRLLLVDACRNDPQADNSRSVSDVKLESVTRPEALVLPGGVAALFSCSAGERAFEHAQLKHGVFFHFVLQGLRGEADLDRDRIVTLPELQQFTLKRVPDFVKAEYGVKQTPDLRGETHGLFPVAKVENLPALPMVKTKLHVTGQSLASRQIVQKYVELVEKQHYSKYKIDDEIARRWMDNLLDDFDPSRVYLLQPDVDRFRALASSIDDKARQGDVGFTWELFDLWVNRRVERLKWVDEWLEAEHDFSVAEELDTRPSPTWPRTTEDAREQWRKQVKQQILNFRAKGYKLAEATHQASRYFHSRVFGGTRSLHDDGLLELGLTALGHALDPQTTYSSAKSAEDFEINLRQRLVGIGAQLVLEDNQIQVNKVFASGPAGQDGRLQRGDRIVGVGEKDGPIQSITDFRLRDVVDLIRGKEGSVVQLQVLSAKGGADPVIYEITRGTVQLSQARSTVFVEERRGDQRPIKIGLISLPNLYRNYSIGATKQTERITKSSSADVAKILSDYRTEGVDVAVLDMRFNMGGPLSEVGELLGLFLDSGPILIQRSRDGQQSTMWSAASRLSWDRPLVVLTSRNTGPGPEIIAGTLQDYRRAIVVGDSRTVGNGTVQELFDVGEQLIAGNSPPKLGAAKITTKQFFLPSGRTNADTGIFPDLTLPSFLDRPSSNSPSLYWKVEPIEGVTYVPAGHVSPKLTGKLNRLASERQAVSPEFQEYLEQVRLYHQQQQQTVVSLTEQEFLRRYQDQVRPPQQDDQGETGVIVRDTYLNEALAIAMDYVPQGRWLEHYSAGMKALRGGAYADAIARFTAAIEQDADQPAAYFHRARAYAGQGDWDKAVADAVISGADAIPASLTSDFDLRAGDAITARLAKGQRVAVLKTNGEWLWVQPIEKSSDKGWVKKGSLAPLLPETWKAE